MAADKWRETINSTHEGSGCGGAGIDVSQDGNSHAGKQTQNDGARSFQSNRANQANLRAVKRRKHRIGTSGQRAGSKNSSKTLANRHR